MCFVAGRSLTSAVPAVCVSCATVCAGLSCVCVCDCGTGVCVCVIVALGGVCVTVALGCVCDCGTGVCVCVTVALGCVCVMCRHSVCRPHDIKPERCSSFPHEIGRPGQMYQQTSTHGRYGLAHWRPAALMTKPMTGCIALC